MRRQALASKLLIPYVVYTVTQKTVPVLGYTNEGCNSCASLAGLVLCFIACFYFTCDRALTASVHVKPNTHRRRRRDLTRQLRRVGVDGLASVGTRLRGQTTRAS